MLSKSKELGSILRGEDIIDQLTPEEGQRVANIVNIGFR